MVKSRKAAAAANLTYRKTARNCNPSMAPAARFVIAEVEEFVPTGTLAKNVTPQQTASSTIPAMLSAPPSVPIVPPVICRVRMSPAVAASVSISGPTISPVRETCRFS
ncbi:MAG: CoA-transferase [Planctomyces sp.]